MCHPPETQDYGLILCLRVCDPSVPVPTNLIEFKECNYKLDPDWSPTEICDLDNDFWGDCTPDMCNPVYEDCSEVLCDPLEWSDCEGYDWNDWTGWSDEDPYYLVKRDKRPKKEIRADKEHLTRDDRLAMWNRRLAENERNRLMKKSRTAYKEHVEEKEYVEKKDHVEKNAHVEKKDLIDRKDYFETKTKDLVSMTAHLEVKLHCYHTNGARTCESGVPRTMDIYATEPDTATMTDAPASQTAISAGKTTGGAMSMAMNGGIIAAGMAGLLLV